MQYFIKRSEKVQGPFSREQLLVLANAKKITAADLVSNSAQGPFQELKTIWASIKNPPAAPVQPAPQSGPPSVPTPVQPVPQSGPPPLSTLDRPKGKNKFLLIGGISGGTVLLMVIVGFLVGSIIGPAEEKAQKIADAPKAEAPPLPTSNRDSTMKSSDTASSKVASAADVPVYVVPEKIENLPPNFEGHTLIELLDEVRKLPYEARKGEFEKTETFEKRMKAIWPEATIFGQKSTDRLIYVQQSDDVNSSYDADNEEISIKFDDMPGEMETQVPRIKFVYLKNIVFPNPKSKTIGFTWKLAPEQARLLMGELRVAFVIKLGPHKSAFSAAKLTNTRKTPIDEFVQGIGYVKDTLVQETYDLWVEELSEILIFRHDTGEVVKRMRLADVQAMYDALVAGDYGKACELDPEHEELKQLRDLAAKLGEKPPECIKTIAVGSGSVKRVSVSNDGQSIAYVLNGSEGTVGIVDVTSDPSPKTISRARAHLNSVAFSPDGNLIGIGGNSFKIGIWDLDSERQTRTINTLGQGSGDSFFVNSVTFSPDSKLLAACGNDNLEIWNVVTGTKVQSLTRESDDVACVKFSPIGGALASGHENGTIKIWDVASGACSKTLKEHQDGITSLAFSQDGKRLVSASRDRSIKIWNLDTGQSEKTFAGEGYEMTVDININGNWIVNNRSGKIQIWDIESGACTELSDGGSGDSECVAFSPDGKTAISGTSQGSIKIWDVESPVAHAKLSSEIDKLSKKVMDEFLDLLN